MASSAACSAAIDELGALGAEWLYYLKSLLLGKKRGVFTVTYVGNMRHKVGKPMYLLCTQRLKVIALDKDSLNSIRHGIEHLVL